MAILVRACTDGSFRDAEGYLDTGFCLPLASGIALLFLGSTFTARWRPFTAAAFWFAVALVGQAVNLQMIEAGTNVSYQHYRPISAFVTQSHPFLPAFIAAQASVVAWGLRNEWAAIFSWGRANLKLWQLACIGLVFFLSSATKINIQIPTYVGELCLATFLQLVNLGTIVLAGFALPREAVAAVARWLDKWLSAPTGVRGSGRPGADRFIIAAALWVVLVAWLLCVFSYERHPHIPDEVVYLWHARYFAQGEIALPPPPVPEAFDLYLAEFDGDHWYSPVPPGWPAVLAIGVALGAPWLVNPVLGGLTVIGIYLLLQELYDRRRARLAVLMICASPWFIFMSMNLMTHTLTLACAVAAALAVVWARRTNRAVWGWCGGAALGLTSLVRPLEGLAMAGLLGLWGIGMGGRRLRASAMGGLVGGAVLIGATVLPYNQKLTGDPTRFPIMNYVDQHFGPGKNALGFGPEKGLGWRGVDPFPGHGAIDVLMNANLNVFSLNTELLGWGIGSTLLMAVAVFSGTLKRPDLLMLSVIAVIVGVHSLYWYSGGPDFGARYWYLIFVPCMALTVRGVDFMASGQGTVAPRAHQVKARVMMVAFGLCILALVNFFPWRAIDKYHHFRGSRPDIRYLAEKYRFGRSLVLIRGNGHDDYASAFIYNPMDLQADAPVYAWDRSPQVRARLLETYADRPVWMVNGPSVTKGPFEVAAGPLSPGMILTADVP